MCAPNFKTRHFVPMAADVIRFNCKLMTEVPSIRADRVDKYICLYFSVKQTT